jgi:hypothetical protein
MLLVPSVPFHCFFCCSPKQGCFNTFIGKLAAKAKEIENPITSLPLHAELLLNDRLDEIPERVFIDQTLKYKLSVFRHLAVYDIRGTD